MFLPDSEGAEPHRYFILNKPANMLSQFISGDMIGLDNLDYKFPEGTHAIGRLDKQTEGLLLLTTDKRITRLLFLSAEPHKRTYLVKVRFPVTQEDIQRLRNGVAITVENKQQYITAPCEADIVDDPQLLFTNPLEAQDYYQYTWLRLSLTEGKYHQVRKMMTAINRRCKRLVRISIEDLTLGGLLPGEVKELTGEDFYRLLKLSKPSVTKPSATG